jgi:uncharacterized protein (TIGR02757 family)
MPKSQKDLRKSQKDLRVFLDRKVEEYNRPAFIASDPISIPHQFSRKQDIEIAGFFAAIFSWGNRTTIIRKSQELMQLMDHSPYQFIRQHQDEDLKKLLGFKHRTFNATDLLYFIAFFKFHYTHYDSLEDAFLRPWEGRAGSPMEGALSAFYHYFFSLEEDGSPSSELRSSLLPGRDLRSARSGRGPVAPLAPPRTHKHIASPEKKSSCKRLNMYLRWMVRKDDKGVDFGIWNRLAPNKLICPLDVHVGRVAANLGLLTRTQSDWQAALELTDYLLILDKEDPVKYDFALFGLGALEKF